MDYIGLAIAIAGAVFYLKAAQHEHLSPLGWVAASIVVSIAVMKFGGGYGMLVVGQLGLLPAIALWRLWRHGDRMDD